jgi:hypothetical protein
MNSGKGHLFDVLLLLAAIPLWSFMIIETPRSPGFGSMPARIVMAPVVLIGITFSVHRLLKTCNHTWPLSILLAAVIPLSVLFTIAWFVG